MLFRSVHFGGNYYFISNNCAVETLKLLRSGSDNARLKGYVKQYWPIRKARLLADEYHPQGVRAVEILKPKGGTRQLGIPSVVDRLIQQALLQQLTPIFDPLFSDCSYGGPLPRGRELFRWLDARF